MRRGFLAAGVITALTPPCNDDGRLVAGDKGTDNTGAEHESVAVVAIFNVVVADKTGASDEDTVGDAATDTRAAVGAGAAGVASTADATGATGTIGADAAAAAGAAGTTGTLRAVGAVGVIGAVSAAGTDTLIPETLSGACGWTVEVAGAAGDTLTSPGGRATGCNCCCICIGCGWLRDGGGCGGMGCCCKCALGER
jgi:hypothetical protein